MLRERPGEGILEVENTNPIVLYAMKAAAPYFFVSCWTRFIILETQRAKEIEMESKNPS
jgi:hypothetical protein